MRDMARGCTDCDKSGRAGVVLRTSFSTTFVVVCRPCITTTGEYSKNLAHSHRLAPQSAAPQKKDTATQSSIQKFKTQSYCSTFRNKQSLKTSELVHPQNRKSSP
jgi:hypothetical protein